MYPLPLLPDIRPRHRLRSRFWCCNPQSTPPAIPPRSPPKTFGLSSRERSAESLVGHTASIHLPPTDQCAFSPTVRRLAINLHVALRYVSGVYDLFHFGCESIPLGPHLCLTHALAMRCNFDKQSFRFQTYIYSRVSILMKMSLHTRLAVS